MDYQNAAILGTEDYHAIMRQVADSTLRRMVNYVPSCMNFDDTYGTLPPVHTDYLERADAMISDLSSYTRISNCNPHSPYLVLAWLLIGSDNKYRICQYVDDVSIAKQVAIIYLRLALGDRPSDMEKEAVTSKAKAASDAAWFDDNRHGVVCAAADAVVAASAIGVHHGTRESMAETVSWLFARDAVKDGKSSKVAMEAKETARVAISTKAHQWAHISDEEALRIARQLTFDILSL